MDIEGYCQKFSPDYADRDTEYQFRCPFCNDYKKRFNVRLKDRGRHKRGYCQCFNCGYASRSFVHFVAKLERKTLQEVYALLGSDESGFTASKPSEFKQFLEAMGLSKPVAAQCLKESIKGIELPKEFRAIAFPESSEYKTSVYAKKAYDYLRTRGLSKKQIRHYGIRYCKSAGRYLGMLVIPVFEFGNIVYFVTRSFLKHYTMKTVNPFLAETVLGKSDVVFNLDAASQYPVVVITEGPFDAITVGPQGVAILGKVMSEVQKQKILSCGFKKAYVMLDADAKPLAFKLCRGLNAAGLRTAMVNLTAEDKDAGNIGHVMAWDRIDSSIITSSVGLAFKELDTFVFKSRGSWR